MAKKAPSPKCSNPKGCPAEQLGLEPKIENQGHVTLAMTWLAWLTAHVASVRVKIKQQVTELTERLGRETLIQIKDGRKSTEVKAEEYAATIEQSLLAYVAEHPEEFFSEKSKTFRTPFGAISSRAGSQFVDLIKQDDETTEAAEERIVRQLLEDADLFAELDRLRHEFGEHLTPYLRIGIGLNRAAILDAYRANTITDEDLTERGLQVKRNDSKVSVKVEA